MLSRDWLHDRRRELAEQIILNQGAIQMIDLVLGQMAESEPEALTVADFAQAIAGNGATAEVVNVGESKR